MSVRPTVVRNMRGSFNLGMADIIRLKLSVGENLLIKGGGVVHPVNTRSGIIPLPKIDGCLPSPLAPLRPVCSLL